MVVQPLVNETDILSQIAEGDHYAFTSLFNHYQPFVYSYGRKLTHSEDMAMEMVQDVFIKIWQARKKLPAVENFSAYLNRLVRNHAFNQLREFAKRSKIAVIQDFPDVEIENSTIQLLEYNETLRIVNEAVDLLAPQQKLAYTLCHRQGMKYEEAAEVMNISSKTVHVHMKYALSKIREHLRKNAVLYPTLAIMLLK